MTMKICRPLVFHLFLALILAGSASVKSLAQTDEYSRSILSEHNKLRELATDKQADSPEFQASFNEARHGFLLAMHEYSIYNNTKQSIAISDAYRIINLWESVLNWLESNIDSSILIEINRYCYEEDKKYDKDESSKRSQKAIEYYGETNQTVLWLNQMDIFSEIPYYQAYLASLSGDIPQFESYTQQWANSLNKRATYYDEFGGNKACFVAGLTELATVLNETSQPDYASKLLMHLLALEIESEEPRRDLMEWVQTATIKFLHEMGDIESALMLSSMSTHSIDGGYNFTNILSQRLDYCYIYRDIDIEEAVRVAEMSIRQIERGDTGRDGKPVPGIMKSAFYNLLYRLYSKKGDHEKAAEYIKESTQIDGDFFQLDHYNNLGTSYLTLGDYDKAEKAFLQCIDYIDSHTRTSEDTRSAIFSNLLSIAILKNETIKISEYAEMYFNDVEKKFLNKSAYMTPRTREKYFVNISESAVILETIACAAVRSQKCSGVAYNAALFQKGLLTRCNNELRNNILLSNDNDLKNAYAGYLEAITLNDDEKENHFEVEFGYYYSRHPEFYNPANSFSWEVIQKALKENEIAIEFATHFDVLTQKQYYDAILLNKNGPRPTIIQLFETEDLIRLVQTRDKTGYPKIYESADLTILSSLIWGKIEAHLDEVKRIYYSPIGELSRLNLDILTSSHTNKTMAESYQMLRVSSTLEIPNMDNNKNLDGIVLCGGIKHGGSITSDRPDFVVSRGGFGELNKSGWKDLKNTFPEVEGIAKLLQRAGNITLLTGNEVKEETLKHMSGNSPSLLHLATHGFYLSESDAHKLNYYSSRYKDNSYIPESDRMGLILSGANDSWTGDSPSRGNDGTLTAREIIGIDMSKTELVVLSACQTGLGEDSHDGTYGFLRAFKNAGVGTLVMSLWKVDDAATQLFMTEFYKFIRKGKDRHTAFKKAQNKVKNTKEYKSPRYWAAFIMLD